MVQIGNVAYTDIFGDGPIVFAETLKDCGGCAMQLCRFIATHINVVNEQLARVEVYYAGKNLPQGRLALAIGSVFERVSCRGGELTRAIIPNNGKGLPRFEGEAHVAQSRFRTSRINVRKIPSEWDEFFFVESQRRDGRHTYLASIFIPPEQDSYSTRVSFLGWRNGSTSIEAQKAPMRNTPCTAIWRVIIKVLIV